MFVDFLTAADDTRLTKTFILHEGTLDVLHYPRVRDFISTRCEITSPGRFHDYICAHAQLGSCLLKGLLDRSLKGESRAGHTQSTVKTDWVMLDLDFEEGWDSVDDFIEELNPAWSNVSYVWQDSPSAGLRAKQGLRGHLFLMLERAVAPNKLKRWLRERNLMIPRLRVSTKLAANGLSLVWPLDITSCQNDRLIYIAPPVCEGLEDPIKTRIRYIKRAQSYGIPPKNLLDELSIEDQTQTLIDRLRDKAGKPIRAARFKKLGTDQLLTNPDPCTITGEKRRRGFVYLNLNGGDSWGYYFPEDRPEIVHNFKNEPLVRLQDIAPEYHHNYVKALRKERLNDIEPYVFRDPKTDQYYNALYRPAEDTLELLSPVRAKSRLTDFLAQYGEVPPASIPDWHVVFDPTTTDVLHVRGRWINRFRPTDYIRYAREHPVSSAPPPTIQKILTSLCADDREVQHHFLNWLATIFQTRQQTGTAWVFHGVQGTGKGLFFSRVLTPLFGHHHVLAWKLQNLEEKFNAPLEQTCILWLDEFRSEDSRHAELVMSKLKNLITEPDLTIRGMRDNPVQVPSYINVIIADNRPCPVQLSYHDRRFNIAPAQETPIELVETDEYSEIERIEEELWDFAAFLAHYPIRHAQARTPIFNNARTAMILASQSTVTQFFRALHESDLELFASFLQSEPPLDAILAYQAYERVLAHWARQILEHRRTRATPKLSREQLRSLFRYIIGPAPTPAKFTRMCHIHRLRIQQMRVTGPVEMGTYLRCKKAHHEFAENLLKRLEKTPLTVIQGGLHPQED